MGPSSVNKLEALGLIVGPVLALVFFLLEPGGMLIDSADPSDPAAIITAMASNSAVTHVSALMVPLGLILMLYGLSGISRVMRPDSMAAALSRLGILCMNIGIFGWILATGLNHIIARTAIEVDQALQMATSIRMVDEGLTSVSSMAVAGGFMAFNLGLSAIYPPGLSRLAALAIAAVSLFCLIAFILGYTVPDHTMRAVARLCYFPWVIWSVVLGSQFLKGHGPRS